MSLLDDILRKTRQSLSQGAQVVGNFVKQDIQRAPLVQQYNAIRQASATPQFQQNYQQVKNAVVNNPVARKVASQPLFSALSILPGAGNANNPSLRKLSPTIGQYTNTIIKPVERGLSNIFQAKNPLQGAQGALETAGGVFNATPQGIAFNTSRGAIAGGINTARTGQSLDKTVRQGILNPSIGGSITSNPALALGIDLATGDFKSAGKLGKTAVKGLYRKPHPDDAKFLDQIAGTLQSQNVPLKDVLGARKDLDQLLKTYIKERKPVAEYEALLKSPIEKQIGTLQDFFRNADVPNPKFQTGYTMGLVSNRKDKSNPPPMRNEKLSKVSQQIPEIESNAPTISSSLPGNSSGGSIAKIPNSENPYFNTNKYNVSNEAKQGLNQAIQDVKPQIEQVVGGKLSNKEVINTANNSSKILHSVVDRSQTEDFAARLLRTRQKLAAAAESGTVDKEYIDNLMAVKSHATDIARKLQSFSIGADPKTVTSRDAILESVLKVEKDSAKVIEAAKGVDFNDLRQATDFYRKFIKPSAGEWIDLVRYNSMLSSPTTHIVNATSNVLNSGLVAPIEKTLTGTLDFLGSKITGKEQTQFAAEGAQYAKGYVGSLNSAAHKFADSLRGKIVTGNLDVRQIPLSTDRRISNLNIPTRLLEASDQFFTALTKGGETTALKFRKGKGVNVGNIETAATENAKYRVFRSELHDKRQGTILNSIDDFTALVQKARNSSNPITSTISKFTLPFVQTPMNIFKQGVEYSPLGFSTIIGAPNKTEQLSKAILGSSAAAATAMLVTSGRTTWAEPADATKKAAFRAAGMQAYAVKIGDNWVSYSKLPPALGFPIAFISALHDAKENKTIDENQLNVILNATAKFGNFFADQSYVKNIGDLVSAAKGSPEAMARFVSNYPQQLVPYRALLGWMARLIDPYQRKINTDAGFLEKQVQQLFTQIPGLSMTVPARIDSEGEPISNQNRELNAFSPLRTTTEKPEKKQLYDIMKQKSLDTKNQNILKDKIIKGEDITALQASADTGTSVPQEDITLPQASADEGNPMADLKAKYQDEILKTKVEQSGKSALDSKGNIIYKNENGNAATIAMTPPTKGEGIDAFGNQNWSTTKALEVYKTPIPQEQKNAAYKKLGVDPKDMEYAYKASKSNDIKSQYAISQAKTLSHNQLLERMITGRIESVSGDMFASDGVLKSLQDAGLLSKAEVTALKKIKLDKNGKPIGQAINQGNGKAKSKALASFFSKNNMELSKLFLSNIKNTTPSNVKNLDSVFKTKRSKKSSIEDILSKSERLVKSKGSHLNDSLGV